MYQLVKLKKIIGNHIHILDVIFSRYVAQAYSELFKETSNCHYYCLCHFLNSISAVLLFYFLQFKIFSVSALNICLSPKFAVSISRHTPFLLPLIMMPVLLLGMFLSYFTC